MVMKIGVYFLRAVHHLPPAPPAMEDTLPRPAVTNRRRNINQQRRDAEGDRSALLAAQKKKTMKLTEISQLDLTIQCSFE